MEDDGRKEVITGNTFKLLKPWSSLLSSLVLKTKICYH
jgi:hypothetical protein